MERPGWSRTPDGQILVELPSGLAIIRRRKHEPIDFDALSSQELLWRTNKVNGSKFLPSWDLDSCVGWLQERLDELGWHRPPGCAAKADFALNQPVGYANGQQVNTIRIVSDGHYVHAYPVEDQ